MKILKKNIHAYMVAYSQTIFEGIKKPFIKLDHRDNFRSDWQEYWPIRKFLIWNNLDEQAYYGFLSPRFTEKTGINGDYLMQYIQGLDDDTDVIQIGRASCRERVSDTV